MRCHGWVDCYASGQCGLKDSACTEAVLEPGIPSETVDKIKQKNNEKGREDRAEKWSLGRGSGKLQPGYAM